jgi:hypothetical protein
VSDRSEPTIAQKESSTSELYAASQSLFNKSAPSSSRKNEATVSPDIIRPFPKAQPRKSASKGRKKGKSGILTDTPNEEEIALIDSKSLANKKQRKCVKRKLIVEKSEDEDDEHMFCRYSSDEDVNMQMLLEQEEGDEIIEEDEIPLGTEKKLQEKFFLLEILFDMWASMLYSPTKMNCFLQKLSVMMVKEQQ